MVAVRVRCIALLRCNGTAIACGSSVTLIKDLSLVLGPDGGRRTALPGSHGAPPWPASLAAPVDQHACEHREWHQHYGVGRDGYERHRAPDACEVDEQCVKQHTRGQHDECHGLDVEPHGVSNIHV